MCILPRRRQEQACALSTSATKHSQGRTRFGVSAVKEFPTSLQLNAASVLACLF